MFHSHAAARRRGFTLIELLIVIVVIAILALIVIPRVMGATRKAREATLRANLHELRGAIIQFNADTGVYPTELLDLIRPKSDAPDTGINDNNVSDTIPPNTYRGPYLNPSGGIGATGIPINPFKDPRDSDFLDETAHWTYGVEGPGIVHPAYPASGSTMDGFPYSDL